MNLIILLLGQIFFLIVSYIIFERDIFSPTVMTMLVVFIATVLVFPSCELWEVTISERTIVTILVGELCCCAGGIGAKQLVRMNRRYDLNSNIGKLEVIHWHKSMEVSVCMVIIVLTMLYIYDALRVGKLYGGTGLNAIGYMKAAYMSDSQGPKMNIFIRQGFKIVMSSAYIGIYYFVNNTLILKERVNRNREYLIFFICGCIITIFSGSRTEILRLLSALILDYIILSRLNSRHYYKNDSVSLFYIIKKFAPVLFACVLIGFASRSIVKIEGTGGSEITSALGYISFYVGSAIQVLNIKLSYFSNFHEFMFGTKKNIPEFVYLGKLDYGGNVASVFGSIINYNGLISMIIYLCLVYFIGMSAYYGLYKKWTASNKQIQKIIIFSYCYFVFTMAYYSMGTSVLLEGSNILVLVLTIVLYRLLPKIKIKC